jgi:hypothetical protein
MFPADTIPLPSIWGTSFEFVKKSSLKDNDLFLVGDVLQDRTSAIQSGLRLKVQESFARAKLVVFLTSYDEISIYWKDLLCIRQYKRVDIKDELDPNFYQKSEVMV